MSYRWQYPGRMQPTLPIARTVAEPLPDKWGPSVQDAPRPKRALTTAVLAGAMFFVPLLSTVAPVTTWHRQTNEPVRVVARPVAVGLTVIDPTGLNRAIRLFASVNEPVRIRPPVPLQGLTVIDPSGLNRQINSFAPLEEPPNAKPPLLQYGLSVIDPITLNLPEPAQIDKWGQPVATPPRGRTPLVPVGLTAFDPLPISITVVPPLDSWEPRLVVPVPPRKPLVALGVQTIDPRALTLPEPAQLDKWYRQLAEPVWVQHLRLRHSDQFAPVFVPTPVARLDSWEARTYGPVPPRPPLVRTGQAVIDPIALKLPEPAQLDKWYQWLSEPRRDRPRWQWLYPWFTADQLFNTPSLANLGDIVEASTLVRALPYSTDSRTLPHTANARTLPHETEKT